MPLSPIQHWFFETFQSAPHYWNQIVTLESDTTLPFKEVSSAVEALVRYHEGLRMAFERNNGGWIARVVPINEVVCSHYFEDVKAAQVESLIRGHQESIQLEEGNLFRMLYLDLVSGEPAKIYLIAHHLIIDMVSWNSIFDDLRQAFSQLKSKQPITFKPKADSLLQYNRYIQSISESTQQDELDYWIAQHTPSLDLPFDNASVSRPFLEKNAAIFRLNIDGPELHDTIQKAHLAYNTNTEDLLLSALYLTLRPYTSNNSFPVYLERHGRAIDNTTVDFTNTMGWFTSFFPLALIPSQYEDMGVLIKDVKEQLRQIPNDGIGYGILKYIQKHEALLTSEGSIPDVVFNYLGQEVTGQKEQEYRFDFLGHSHRDPSSERLYALEINAFTTHSGLLVRFTYDQLSFEESTIKKLTETFKGHLMRIIEHCTQSDSTGFTPSDFPEAQMSQDDLDNLLEQLG